MLWKFSYVFMQVCLVHDLHVMFWAWILACCKRILFWFKYDVFVKVILCYFVCCVDNDSYRCWYNFTQINKKIWIIFIVNRWCNFFQVKFHYLVNSIHVFWISSMWFILPLWLICTCVVESMNIILSIIQLQPYGQIYLVI